MSAEGQLSGVPLALAAGADGVGLIRTELPFLDRSAWPAALDHRLFLEPILFGVG
jgi:phosphoenolpyruvate-protein kinase (PTS system EI component)